MGIARQCRTFHARGTQETKVQLPFEGQPRTICSIEQEGAMSNVFYVIGVVVVVLFIMGYLGFR
ncbi:MAG TPA: hypothetical protein VNC82_22270 [Candidatus Limnocylindria bacterium]|nr:hypothetical protein [Candidatus Limnocylindria bacterium]